MIIGIIAYILIIVNLKVAFYVVLLSDA